MYRLSLAILSALLIWFAPPHLPSPLAIGQHDVPITLVTDTRSMDATARHLQPYRELLQAISLEAGPAVETRDVYLWQDHQGNLHFSDKERPLAAEMTTYTVENRHVGRFAFPTYWVVSVMALCWAGLYLLLCAMAYLVERWMPSRRQALVRQKGTASHDSIGHDTLYSGARSGYSPHAVLGISEDASHDEIRNAYRSKIRQYHPDRVAHLGKEFQHIAKRKSLEINAAFDALRQK